MIRIIGGRYRGKKIPIADLPDLRPTPNRIRETLFNWLMHHIQGARCLDAFAGSGALGLEAYSRGAAEVVFIEHVPQAHMHLQKIIKQWNTPQLSLLCLDSRIYLKQPQQPFDIIFLDPPFNQNHLPSCLLDIAHNKIITKGGLLYLEMPHPVAMDDTQWKQVKLKTAGQVHYGLFEKRT